jgi:membrane fusion protein (multidrug efflux system)
MNPIAFVKRRPIITFLLVAILAGGGFLGFSKNRAEHLAFIAKSARQVQGYAVAKYESYVHKKAAEGEGEEAHHDHKIFLTSPLEKDVTITQEYVCQIHSQRHIEVQALEGGYLESVPIKEGQAVKKGDLMFKIIPILYQAKLDAEVAEADVALMEWNYSKTLADQKGISLKEVALYKAKLAKAEAKKKLAQAEVDFASIKAPFDGIVDRLHDFQGSLIKEGDILTTLSDNSVMWVYFNVPEKRYLEYMAELGQGKDSPDIELELANLKEFPQKGKIGAIEAKFNPETGNIPFRADFPNPDRLLRHGQTGKVLIRRKLNGAIVIPQRATFENLAKRYVYVVNKDDVVHQREIAIQHELEDIYVINSPLGVDEKIIFEGIRQVHDGQKLENPEFIDPKKVLENLKNKAE